MELPERVSRDQLHDVFKALFQEIDQQIWREVKNKRTPTDRLQLLNEADVVKRVWNRFAAYFGPGAEGQ